MENETNMQTEEKLSRILKNENQVPMLAIPILTNTDTNVLCIHIAHHTGTNTRGDNNANGGEVVRDPEEGEEVQSAGRERGSHRVEPRETALSDNVFKFQKQKLFKHCTALTMFSNVKNKSCLNIVQP